MSYWLNIANNHASDIEEQVARMRDTPMSLEDHCMALERIESLAKGIQQRIAEHCEQESEKKA